MSEKLIPEIQKDLDILKAMKILFEHCCAHPTCENCQFKVIHIGCAFRNQTPREWFG